jgi:hypothetical protein
VRRGRLSHSRPAAGDRGVKVALVHLCFEVRNWPLALFAGGRQSKALQTCRGNCSIVIDPESTSPRPAAIRQLIDSSTSIGHVIGGGYDLPLAPSGVW